MYKETLFEAENLNTAFLFNYVTQFNNFRKSVKDCVSHRWYREMIKFPALKLTGQNKGYLY